MLLSQTLHLAISSSLCCCFFLLCSGDVTLVYIYACIQFHFCLNLSDHERCTRHSSNFIQFALSYIMSLVNLYNWTQPNPTLSILPILYSLLSYIMSLVNIYTIELRTESNTHRLINPISYNNTIVSYLQTQHKCSHFFYLLLFFLN